MIRPDYLNFLFLERSGSPAYHKREEFWGSVIFLAGQRILQKFVNLISFLLTNLVQPAPLTFVFPKLGFHFVTSQVVRTPVPRGAHFTLRPQLLKFSLSSPFSSQIFQIRTIFFHSDVFCLLLKKPLCSHNFRGFFQQQ